MGLVTVFKFIRMVIRNLSTRIFLFLSAWSIVAVALVAIVISADYRANAERRFSELLTANVYSLMGGVQRNPNGDLISAPDLGDSRFNEFDSGWYWQINSVKEPAIRMGSISLSTQRLEVPEEIPLNEEFQRYFETQDEAGNRLSGLEAQVFLGEGDTLYSFKVTGNLNTVNAEVREFVERLLFVLALFGASLVLASYVLVRIGLRPLKNATGDLGKIRRGEVEKLEGQYPDEVQPLIEETNALIVSNTAIIERARTQVGNLAHSLKTPIAVVVNELTGKRDKTSKLVLEQMQQMQNQTKIYLDRARISARYGAATSRTDVALELGKLVKVVQKLNSDLSIGLRMDSEEGLMFAGESADLQEIIGNLLENAAKFARSSIEVGVSKEPEGHFSVTIDDDGPGMTDSEMQSALERGKRFDESKPGTGLGLSIVREIISEYRGTIRFSNSPLGGLRATVRLNCAD